MILKIEMQNSEWLIWLFHSQFLLRLSCCEMLWLYMGKADYKAFYGAFMAIYLKNYLFSLRIIYFMTYLTDLRVTVMKWFVTKQNKWVKPVEKHAEIPATTSGHLQLHALITCNSGQHLVGNSELFPVWLHTSSFRNVACPWHLAVNSFIARCHLTMN